jgi:hypothetical protein
VSAPGYQEGKGKAGAFWMEAGDEPAKKGTREQAAKRVGTRAWLETVHLAPASAGDKKSEIKNVAVLLAEPHLEPTLITAGGTVKLRVKLNTPPPPPGRTALAARVFAREDKKRVVVELKPQPDAPSVFAGDLAVDPMTPAGPTTITIVALRTEPVEVNLKESQADPLLDFAKGLEDLDADKPYEFDPRIMASENRHDVALTILDPKQGTPTTATSTAPPPAPASGNTPAAPGTPAPAPPAPAPAPANPPAPMPAKP